MLVLFSFGCKVPSTEEIENKEVMDIGYAKDISIRKEIPIHIKEIENLSIFSGQSEPIYNAELIKEHIYGEGNEFNFYWIFNFFVDKNGRLIFWGLDFNRGEGVYVFNSDGSFKTQLGRHGRGPGEYSLILRLVVKDEKIFITDYGHMRLNEYSTHDYSFIKSTLFETWKISEESSIVSVQGRNDENYLVSYASPNSQTGWNYSKNIVFDENGEIVSENFLNLKEGIRIKIENSIRPTLPVNFLGYTFTALSTKDELYTAWSPEFIIKKYDSNNVYQSAIYYPLVGVPFNLEDHVENNPFSANLSQINRAFSKMDIKMPKYSPLIQEIIIDDENRIWVLLAVGQEKKKYEWWILNESGVLLAKLSTRQNQRIYDIENGFVYTRKDNGKSRGELYNINKPDEEDAEFVIKYRIKLSKK